MFEIINIANNLKTSKASGYDELSPKVLKAAIPYLADILANTFNLSVKSGVFPDLMKIAKVVPVHKSDDKKVISNYRPISVLESFHLNGRDILTQFFASKGPLHCHLCVHQASVKFI